MNVTADAENLVFFPWIPVLHRHVPGSIQNLKHGRKPLQNDPLLTLKLFMGTIITQDIQ
jgi:hypothetical protein